MLGNQNILMNNEQRKRLLFQNNPLSNQYSQYIDNNEIMAFLENPLNLEDNINKINVIHDEGIDNGFYDFSGLKKDISPEKNNKSTGVKKAGDTMDFKTKWKTEKCHYWEMYGNCKFGENCAFAHGDDELKFRNLSNNYKTKRCKQFFEAGYCPYGSRCQFSHKINFEELHKTSRSKPIAYTKIIPNLLVSEEVSLKIIRRPRLRIFEKIKYCSLQEIEQSRIRLYKDIIQIRNQLLNKPNNY